MVLANLMWRPREAFDVNDMNFITDPTDPTKIITDPDFVSSAWSTTEWLSTATDDDCGFFTTFLVRPGARKLNQQKIQVTIQQKAADYTPSLFSIAFFGSRPGTYNDATDVFTPLQPYFSMNNMNTMMMCDTLKSELKDKTATSVTTKLETKNVIPPPIALTAGGFYRENVIQDCALITPFDFTSSIVKGNFVATNHQIPMPMFPTFSDNLAAPDGFAIQSKIIIYFTTTNYSLQIPPNSVTSPSMGLVANTDILSFSSPIQFL